MINYQLVVQQANVVRQIAAGQGAIGANKRTLQAFFEGWRDRQDASRYAVAVMQQCIVAGLCNDTIIDGKRQGQTSNVKRCIANAVNDAYPNYGDKFALVTRGKGDTRTVHAEWRETTDKSAVDKIRDAVRRLCESVNATEAEQASLTERFVYLYEAEGIRQEIAKEEAQEAREQAATALLEEKIVSIYERFFAARQVEPTASQVEAILAVS